MTSGSNIDDRIPVIDIFAGPGGLGEGFAASPSKSTRSPFRIVLSIEMDKFAHQTLLLRSFYRQFEEDAVPDEYYSYLRHGSSTENADLGSIFHGYPDEVQAAEAEAWNATLGEVDEREVDRRIRRVLGRTAAGQHWILIGGPPCQAYSIIGRVRSLAQHGKKFYKDRKHTLYREYLRLIAAHKPTIFIMENVKGLLSSTFRNGDSVISQIVRDLKRPREGLEYELLALGSYSSDPQHIPGLSEAVDPCDFVVECEKHGIPQARHRIIILGIRSDQHDALRSFARLQSRSGRVSCKHAIDGLPPLRSGLSRQPDNDADWLAWIKASVTREWFRYLESNGGREIARTIQAMLERCRVPASGRGGRFVSYDVSAKCHQSWYVDPRLRGACNHETRPHMAEDLHRYLFVSAFAEAVGRSPKLDDFPPELLPEHKNVKTALNERLFNDRFRVQVADKPATTMTSHMAKDGHYFIHYDPSQCRSFTVREAARLQTFPDNYYFEGPRTEQYRQVGNAVPPLLAKQIAKAVTAMLRPDKAEHYD